MTEATGPEIVSPELLTGDEVALLLATAEQTIEAVRACSDKQSRGYRTDVDVAGNSHIYQARDRRDVFHRLIVGHAAPGQPDMHLLLQRIIPTKDHLYLSRETSFTIGRDYPSQPVAEHLQLLERCFDRKFDQRGEKFRVAATDAFSPRQAGEAAQLFLDTFLLTIQASKVPQQPSSWLGRLGLRRAS